MTDPAAPEDQVRQAELERCRAVSERDLQALEALLDDEYSHIHANGRVDDRAAVLTDIVERPRAMRRADMDVRLHGDIAIVTGVQYLVLPHGEVENVTTMVWKRADSGWRALAFHASRDPG